VPSLSDSDSVNAPLASINYAEEECVPSEFPLILKYEQQQLHYFSSSASLTSSPSLPAFFPRRQRPRRSPSPAISRVVRRSITEERRAGESGGCSSSWKREIGREGGKVKQKEEEEAWDGIHQIVSRFLERFRYMCPLLFSCVFPS
jgi:hypothetical protein